MMKSEYKKKYLHLSKVTLSCVNKDFYKSSYSNIATSLKVCLPENLFI